jgi:hypothetical protein
MDGILALSALHFAHENVDSRWEYTELAIHYQNSALRRYQSTLKSITDSNRGAMFAFSILLNILALAFPNVDPKPALSSYTASVITLMELLRGIGLVLRPDDSIRHGKFEALFRPFLREQPPPVPSDEITNALSALRNRADNIKDPDDEARHKAYLSGIESLEISFGFMRTSNHLSHVIAWPTMVAKELLQLYKQGDPMARLIFIHYGVLLLHTRDRWWGINTGACLVENLARDMCVKNPEWDS